MNSEIQAEIQNAQPLVGGTILSFFQDPTHEYWGFCVRLRNGREAHVWVNCDPEGNGPGHLEIDHQP